MRKIFSSKSLLVIAAAMLFSSVVLGQANSSQRARDDRQGGQPLVKMVKVDLPCAVQATKIGNTNKYNVKLVATNNTSSWLPEGKKINFTYGPTMKGSMVLDLMLPISSAFTIKQFQYTADPYVPTAVPCAAYFYNQVK